MKKTNFLWMAALIIALVMVASACKNDGIVSLPGAQSVKDLPAIPDGVNFVASETEAKNLVDGIGGSLNGLLSTAHTNALSTARSSNESYLGYVLDLLSKNSASYSVSIDDSTTLKNMATGATTGTIKGTKKYSVKTNNPTLLSSDRPVGYTYSTSDSWKADFVIKDLTTYISGYKVGGYVTVEKKTSYDYKKTADSDTGVALKYNSDNDTVTKVSIALTIVDTSTNKAAKIRWSSASDSEYQIRKVTNKGSSATSDLEVYNNAGDLKFTIKGYDNYSLSNF